MLFIFCSEQKPQGWQIHLRGQGTASSPRLVDLNNDGVLDVVLGAGGYENMPSDTAVIALDGRDGRLLWHVPGRNQVVGSANFKDISGDKIPDIFIGGRTGELLAINGATGKEIWRFYPLNTKRLPADSGIYNFYNPQFIPDQDNDGQEDILISNGGDYRVKPNDPRRPAGKLMVISAATGKVLAQALVPDGRETYMSLVKVALQPGGDEEIIFGTGGETIGGHLYRVSLKELLNNNISAAVPLAEGKNKGFVAPPLVTDITEDGIYDIIANTVDGRILAINGATDSLIWQVITSGTEIYSSPAVGYFNNDRIPDFFVNAGIGKWPRIKQSVQYMIDGKTGEIKFQKVSGTFLYGSPVTADFNNDGFDDGLISINSREQDNSPRSQLWVYDFHNKKEYPISATLEGNNIGSTPWLGDMDQDGQLDIVSSTINIPGSRNDIDRPTDLRVFRLKTNIPLKKEITWGSYMGNHYNGILQNK
ncbi:outer membrane protein assembly factor BamB family protein [Adhaeribacter rhizoryzae]|uniref:PQQ-binding-like beta-propeller repeat protein n=1 Tax=Adhaeribacter rhizoryzae TaxID=2607907 RepID=A0A5M6DUL5_9BACT|nr:PQQ-binding-like beta-propeller repeat protein [Adhaeribacter rhizoryzae]KAA5549135.1 PQQ-binding-like beta-propeller repeat protein [Adhaeribacter rhizoryzae]